MLEMHWALQHEESRDADVEQLRGNHIMSYAIEECDVDAVYAVVYIIVQ